MFKMSAFSFDVCCESFAKAQNRFAGCFIRQIVYHNNVPTKVVVAARVTIINQLLVKLRNSFLNFAFASFWRSLCETTNTFCGTWYLAYSHVHNERTVPIIMAGCMVHARNGYISTSGLKSDVAIVFLDPDFL